MATATPRLRLDAELAKELREFGEANFLDVGKFAEHAVREVMEDFYFGGKAQRLPGQQVEEPIRHRSYFSRRRFRK